VRRPTIILLIIFLLLATFTWYMQSPSNPIKTAVAASTPVPSVSSGSLISPEKAPISRISIENSDGKKVILDRSSGKWLLNTGIDTPVDQNLAESASGQLFYIQILARLENKPDPAATGLNKPSYTISVSLADQSIYIFKIGRLTVTSSGYYAQANDGSTYVLNKSDVDSLLKIFTEPPFLQTPTPNGASILLTPTKAP
jgi:hypothetical protein